MTVIFEDVVKLLSTISPFNKDSARTIYSRLWHPGKIKTLVYLLFVLGVRILDDWNLFLYNSYNLNGTAVH